MWDETLVDQKLISTRLIEGKPKHNVIYSAATGTDGNIYLGLSGEMDSPGTSAQLIRYDPAADRFEDVADLADLIKQPEDSLRHPHSKIHTSICIGNGGKVYAATHMTAPPRDEDFYHYWHVYNDPARSFEGSHLIIYDPATRRAEDFGVIAPKGGCRWLAHNPEREELYLTTFLTAHFMVVKLKTGEVRDLGRISQYDFMGPCYSACGSVYTTDCYGFLLRYDTRKETIEKLPLKIPNAPWRNSDGNGVFHLVPGPDRVRLYGVSALGQRVFEFDPTAGRCGRIRDYGTLCGEDRMDAYSFDIPLGRTMAVGRDGKIYLGTKNYISGKPGAHIVSIDIESGEKTHYGVMQVKGFTRIDTPVAATVGLNGDVYFTAEQPDQRSPMQVILFNPAGIHRKPPARPEGQAHPAAAAPADLYRFSYHFPSRNRNSAFVTRGSFYAQELGWAGRTPVIPRNECAITALAVSDNGTLFGATSGERSHFFTSLPLTRRLIPLTTVGEGPSTCRAMVADAQGRIYLGTMGAGPAKAGGHLYLYDAPEMEDILGRLDDRDKGEFCLQSKPPVPELTRLDDLGEIVPGEGIGAMVIDPGRNCLYGLSHPGGKFFIHDLDNRTTSIKDIFAEYIVKTNHISRAMIVANGQVYFSGAHGYVMAYNPGDDRFRRTAMKIPAGAGREYLNAISALTCTGDGRVYGGTLADGYMFMFDPQEERLLSLGKPSSESHVRSLATGHDGIIWGLCGTRGELVHLIRYDPLTGALGDCGLMRAKQPKTWIVHSADVLVTGPDGELYIGESDALSHLVVYHPPVEKR